jgi:signal transduction histidine kinase
MNLLNNAIRHAPPRGRVHVEARREGGDALLAVADGCGGIPEADLAHVFELAWRGTDARSPAPDGGVGLGLAIVRGVAEAHRGSVSVVNTEGGCCFEIRLPGCLWPAVRPISGRRAPPRSPRPPRRTAPMPASRVPLRCAHWTR